MDIPSWSPIVCTPPATPLESDLRSTLSRFGSHWDNLPQGRKDESVIIDYAKQKLLDGPNVLRSENRSGSLACLSVRFALEFNMDDTARDVTYAQVERHMRLCIAATAGLEKMTTIPGSEPLLAEATYELMKDTRTNAVRHLADHSDLNCIDRGRRGELVAALLIMQAYDAARSMPVAGGRRWVSVVDFMKALLPATEYETLRQSGPTFWRTNEDIEITFEGISKEYGVWFNHLIKIEDRRMVSIDHLWKFVTRGAMIMCATNQEGIDIVLPVCQTTRNLGPDSVTAIIVQVKNAINYGATHDTTLYDAMDSAVTSAIFSTLPETVATTKTQMPEKVTPKPVIRLVFALASPEPAVVFRERAVVKHHLDGFTTFDIWLAGLSEQTFRQIGEDLEPYNALLERSVLPHDAFELKDDKRMGEKARILRGARRRRMAPLNFPGVDHGNIHQEKDPERNPAEGHKTAERMTRNRPGAS